MRSDDLLRLRDAAREERVVFVFNGDDVEVAVAVAGSSAVREFRLIDLAQVRFDGLI